MLPLIQRSSFAQRFTVKKLTENKINDKLSWNHIKTVVKSPWQSPFCLTETVRILMILNDWQNFFLAKIVPTLESLGSVLAIIAFIALFILLPALVYSCNKNIRRCYRELKRQNRLLQNQAENIHELNSWMHYFDDKIIKREKTSATGKIDPKKVSSSEKIRSTEKIKPQKVVSPEKRDSPPLKKDQPRFPDTPVSIYKKTI